jgi:hypothetical protein
MYPSAEMLHEFLSSVQNSSSRLTAPASTAEEYVDKLTAQAELIGREKALDLACTEVHNLYGLLDEFGIKVPDVDRASYATLDSSYALLKTIMEELDGNKEEAVQKYSAELEAGEQGDTRVTTVLCQWVVHEEWCCMVLQLTARIPRALRDNQATWTPWVTLVDVMVLCGACRCGGGCQGCAAAAHRGTERGVPVGRQQCQHRGARAGVPGGAPARLCCRDGTYQPLPEAL